MHVLGFRFVLSETRSVVLPVVHTSLPVVRFSARPTIPSYFVSSVPSPVLPWGRWGRVFHQSSTLDSVFVLQSDYFCSFFQTSVISYTDDGSF